ncbi:MAG: carbohydrate kinase family protein [Bacteroidota bacterium]
MNKNKIVVLGPIPRDHIVTHKGEVFEKYGCVTHPVIALAKVLEQEGEVIPVSHVQKQDEEPIKQLLSGYPSINTDHITSDMDQGDVISLKFVDQNTRLEKQTAFMNPILPEDVDNLLDADVFVFVPITDFEVSLDTLKHLRAKSNGLIIFDAHGPTNTMTVNGDRHHKFWVDRDQWLPYIDVLKMNLEESRFCWFEKEYSESALREIENDIGEEHLPDFAEHCMKMGIKALIVTLDSRGCMVYTQNEGVSTSEFINAVKVDDVVDTTGCGDSFAGGLAYGFLNGLDHYHKAARFANAFGAMRTQGSTFDVFKSLKETEEIIKNNY